MKKILLFLFAVLTSAFAMADEVTIAYSGATTNMTGGNDAAILGLEATEWSVVGAKGGNGNFPGLNKSGQIRLYGSATSHNTLTISNLGGATISSVEIEYGAAGNNNALVTVAGSSVEGTGTDTKKVYAIGASEFVLTHNYTTTTQVFIKSIVVTYGSAGKASAPTLTTGGVFTTTPYDVTITNNESGATVYYTTDGNDPTTSSDSFTGDSKTISISATTTVKAMAVIAGKDNSSIASATYTYEQSIANTKETAYTTAQAIALIDANSAQLKDTKVYVKGTVSSFGNNKDGVNAFNATYGSITYWLDDNAFEVYGGLDNNGEKFESVDDVKKGAEVIVYGIIKKYNTTYEMDQNNWLVDYKASAKPNPTLTATTKTTLEVGKEDSYGVTYTGDGEFSCESSDTEVATIAWNDDDSEFVVTALKPGKTTITITASETANYQEAKLTYTLTVTEVFAAAAIPFEFDGGKADVTPGKGMTQTGLGSDYTSSPKLKFDTTADELVINIAEAADYLHYVIKGNSYADAKDKEPAAFDVQESANGTEYTSLKHYGAADLKEQLAENNVELSATTRYIKFVYTNKAAGNVALGAIKINNEVTGINTVETEGTVKVQKTVKNGRLVIEKAGKQYNAAGALLK